MIRAAVTQEHWLAAVVAVLVGFLTLVAMAKIWNGVFWGHEGEVTWEEENGGQTAVAVRVRTSLIAPGAVLAGLSVALGLGAQPLLAASEAAAAGLVDASSYVAAVIG